MARGRSTSGILLTAAIFILLEVAAVALLHSSASLQDIWLNRASHHVIGWVWGAGDSIHGYFSLKEKNQRLEEENAVLSEALRHYRAKETEDSVRRSFDIPLDGFKYIFAKTVKMSINSQHNHVVLNKGWEDGVTDHCGIITNQGVVGIIDAVDRHYCYGRTLMNPNISVSVRIGHGDIAGPLVWDGMSTRRAIMQGVPLFCTPAPGDTVWTSGYSSIFPAGIPVGVVRESSTRTGATRDVAVDLFQDFSTIDYVTIVRNVDMDRIEALEKKEDKR